MENEIRTGFTFEGVPKETTRFIEFSMKISEKILDLLDEQEIGKREFARSIGKKESQISEWLSGMHNFTIRTLAEISAKYELDFSDAFRLAEVQQQNFNPIQSKQEMIGKTLLATQTPYLDPFGWSYKKNLAGKNLLKKNFLESIIIGVDNKESILNDETTFTAPKPEIDTKKPDPQLYGLVA